jgi:hypothetical protein
MAHLLHQKHPSTWNFTEVLTDPNETVNTFYNTAVLFTCIAPTVETSFHNLSEWKTTICQQPRGGSAAYTISGGLISEFRPLSSLPTPKGVTELHVLSQIA